MSGWTPFQRFLQASHHVRFWLREVLEKVYAAGALQRGLADDSEVRRSGARSDRLRAVVCAARPSLVTAVKTRHTLWCCVAFVPCPITSPPEASRQRGTGCSRSWSGRTARRAEPRNTRPTTTTSSCGATTMIAANEVSLVVISQDTSRKTAFFLRCLFWNLPDGGASLRPLDDDGGGADAELWRC